MAAVKPFLTPANKQRRHKWAKSHSSWSKRGWRTVLFSDETHIEILADSYRTKKVRRSKEDSRDDLKFCRSSTKHPLKLMVWGCLGAGKLGRLAIIPDEDSEDEKVPAAPRRERPKGKKAKKQKRVNQDVYIQVLEEHLAASMEMTGCTRFQQDGAPCHTGAKADEWFFENEIDVLSWAPQSPDMNPIENCWTLLKQEVVKLPAAGKSSKRGLWLLGTIWPRGLMFFRVSVIPCHPELLLSRSPKVDQQNTKLEFSFISNGPFKGHQLYPKD